MQILLNPEIGAPIQDIQISGRKYFVEKPWEINSMKKFDDDKVAEAFKNLYDFLVIFDLDQAKQYVEEQAKKKFKCDKCVFVTTTPELLKAHNQKHTKEEELVRDLGVEEVTGDGEALKEGKDVQTILDEQAKSEGLIGEGLVDETRPIVKRF